MEKVAPAVCIKMILHFSLACEFGMTSLSLEKQIHAELVIIQKSSLVYLAEARAGTEVSETGASKRPALLGAGVLYSKSLSSSAGGAE